MNNKSKPGKAASDDERPSKTQRKQEMAELQSLGERLVGLGEGQLASVEMPEFLRDAVKEARRIKGHESLRRQMQYIGRLMRDVDPVPIRSKIAQWDGQSSANVAQEHAIVRWRERLLEDETALTEFARQFPGADTRQLRLLARNANAEHAAGKPPKSFRELFRLVRETVTAQDAAKSEASISAAANAENPA